MKTPLPSFPSLSAFPPSLLRPLVPLFLPARLPPSQFVPPGAFGGATPEKKASAMLTAMMTYIATWIVIDQTESVAPLINTNNGADGEALGSDCDDIQKFKILTPIYVNNSTLSHQKRFFSFFFLAFS